jgi:tetratricopeptide (TPR) repeat protein
MWRLLLVLAFVPVVAHAAVSRAFYDDPGLNDRQRYNRCLKLAHDDSDTAYEQALAWHDAGGGPAAVHCSAVALFQKKHFGEAAFKFDQLAHGRDTGDADLRADLLDQAGNAWLLAGQPENAEASFAAAIGLGARGADVYADRARARGLRKDWSGADADLTVALSKDEYRSDLLVLRASARHALGRRKEARNDIDQALEFDPHYADALVERGAMKLEAGDKAGARADWTLVLAVQPKSPAADSARMHIERLEFSGGNSAQRKPTTPHSPPDQSRPSRTVHTWP